MRYFPYLYKSLGAVWLVLTLHYCGLTNRYQSPAADTYGLYRGDDPYQEDTTTIAHIPWRAYFSDPLLRLLIDKGIYNNYDMGIAYARIQQAEANLSIARGAWSPNVGVSASITHDRTSNGEQGRDVLGYHTNQYSLGVAATWEADIWGKIAATSRAQYAQLLNSYAYRNLVQTSLIANIATGYYTLLALDEQLKITLETIVLLKESSETMEALKDAGMLTGAAVEQSNALLYSTEVTVPDLLTQIQQTENSLCQLVGRKPGPIIRGNLRNQVVQPQLAHGVPMQMLARRPDVRQAELAFRSSFESVQAVRAAFYPSITLNSGTIAGYASTTLSHFFKPENIIANILGGAVQPLFAQRQLTGNLKLARAQQEEALLNFESTVLSAGVEVSNILYSYQSSLSKNSIREQQIESMLTAVYYTQELLKAGEANYTEVLTAEQNLLSALLNRVSDKLEQLQYSVTLYRALGGGWE
ncbi:MAG: TolC family protein [Bacteroides sp.]|nr:TolC family protein [Bacteroides sp.]